MIIQEFINSISGLITAVASLLIGVAAVITAIYKIREGRGRRDYMNKGNDAKKRKNDHIDKGIDVKIIIIIIMGLMLIGTSGVIFAQRFGQKQSLPKNVQLTNAAWSAYNKGDNIKAISIAKECIDEFRGAADREQQKLLDQLTPLPRVGRVSEDEKAIIISRGLLNDVATCFFIAGRSYEKLGNNDEARRFYTQALRYTYARTWDPNGWFWSPTEASQDRINELNSHLTTR